VYDDPAEAVRGASCIVISVPVLATAPLLERCLDSLACGAVVTDVGSTKQKVTDDARVVLQGNPAVFVGSHPIAGSDQAGLDAAMANLYEGATVVVTRDQDAETSEPERRICTLWEGVGAHVAVMSPEAHDRILARTSHLPHMVASLLARTVGRGGGGDEVGSYCGAGFLDTTRIAGGAPAVWLDILRTNRVNVDRELGEFARYLDTLREGLRKSDDEALESLLFEAKEIRQSLERASQG
jgi:prephenate dehydrogenase